MSESQPALSPMAVQSKCPRCKNTYNFTVPREGFAKRSKGVSWKESFPTLDPTIIRQLTDHVCPACQALEVA